MFILASQSPRRRELLSMLGLTFEIITADIDETMDPTLSVEDAVAQVLALKAQGHRLKDAAKEVAEHTGLSKNELYAAALEK